MTFEAFGGRHRPENDSYLEGQMLIAMPTMGDPRFERTLIYLCAHSEDGAMGLVINKRASNITFPELLKQLSIQISPESGVLGADVETLPVLFGGPVETGRGFVLHSQDYYSDESTLPVADDVGLTSTIDILRAIACGTGPTHALLALGYSGWAPGQLEAEIQANGWLHCEADADLLFAAGLDDKYEKALAKLGVDLSLLSGDAGHA